MQSRGSTSSRSRGVSTVIGFVLIFGIATVAYSVYLGTAVPQQNWQAEYSHNQQTQQQMLEVRDGILETGTGGSPQTATIQLGVDYPERLMTPNLAISGGATGTIKPNPDGDNNITLSHIIGTDSETADYLDSTSTKLEYPTRELAYVPAYTRYQDAPTTKITAGTVFNSFDESTLPVGSQLIVDGEQITLVVLNGSFRTSGTGGGATASVKTKPLSVSEQSVRVENTNSENIELKIPTTVTNESAWRKSGLGDQDTVTDISTSDSAVTIQLAQGTYDLRMLKVGMGSNTDSPSATYVVESETLPVELSEERTGQVTVEVRDRFNNPVAGASVTADIVTQNTGFGDNGDLFIGNSGSGETITASTNSDGKVTFTYQAPSDNNGQPAQEDVELQFSINGNSAEYERVTDTVTIVDDDGGGNGPPGNGGGPPGNGNGR